LKKNAASPVSNGININKTAIISPPFYKGYIYLLLFKNQPNSNTLSLLTSFVSLSLLIS